MSIPTIQNVVFGISGENRKECKYITIQNFKKIRCITLFFRLNSKKFIFGLLSSSTMFTYASYVYRSSTISTMEKQYHYNTKEMGVIISFMEYTAAIGNIVIPYVVSTKGHFPRWMAVGYNFKKNYPLNYVLIFPLFFKECS